MSDGTDQTFELPRPDEPASVAAPNAHTTQLPVTQRSFATQQIALVFCAVAAASFLLGIAIATSTRPKSDQIVVASEDVGPSGKTIGFDGGDIRIPDGAVTRDVRVVVRRSTVTDRIRVEGADVVRPGSLVAYSFEPTDVTFREPVEITFQLSGGARNAAVFARRDSTVVLLSGTVDADDGTATAVVRDFRFEGGRR